jgi:hypothetical protein
MTAPLNYVLITPAHNEEAFIEKTIESVIYQTARITPWGLRFLAEFYGADSYYQRAVHFLEVLEQTRCPGYKDHAWGYPFDWQTKTGTTKEGTPLITTSVCVRGILAGICD